MLTGHLASSPDISAWELTNAPVAEWTHISTAMLQKLVEKLVESEEEVIITAKRDLIYNGMFKLVLV